MELSTGEDCATTEICRLIQNTRDILEFSANLPARKTEEGTTQQSRSEAAVDYMRRKADTATAVDSILRRMACAAGSRTDEEAGAAKASDAIVTGGSLMTGAALDTGFARPAIATRNTTWPARGHNAHDKRYPWQLARTGASLPGGFDSRVVALQVCRRVGTWPSVPHTHAHPRCPKTDEEL